MKKEKKIISHRIVEKNIVLGMILLTLLTYVIVSLVIGTLAGALVAIPAAIADRAVSENVVFCVYAVASLIMLAIHKRWFYPEYEGSIRIVRDPGKWILVSLGVLAAITIPDLIVMLATKGNFAAPTFTSVTTAFLAGVTEEIIFRAVSVSFAMRQIGDPKRIPVALLVSSAIFSLVHATNIFAGASVGATVVQLLSSFGAGLILCALFLRSGSILLPMGVHFLYDVYALMNADSVNERGIMEAALSARDVAVNVLLFVIEVGIAVYLLRKSVRGEVMDVWKKKWNKPENSEL